jgi:hypothetical protein
VRTRKEKQFYIDHISVHTEEIKEDFFNHRFFSKLYVLAKCQIVFLCKLELRNWRKGITIYSWLSTLIEEERNMTGKRWWLLNIEIQKCVHSVIYSVIMNYARHRKAVCVNIKCAFHSLQLLFKNFSLS